MSEKQYTYAVARIRAKENALLNDAFMEQLIGAKSEDEALALLSEKGWKGRDEGRKQSPQDILSYEEEKTFDTVLSMVDDPHAFDVFLLKRDYHNLKAAVKLTVSSNQVSGIFVDGAVQFHRFAVHAAGEHVLCQRHLRGWWYYSTRENRRSRKRAGFLNSS